jgi:hypothetical protein
VVKIRSCAAQKIGTEIPNLLPLLAMFAPHRPLVHIGSPVRLVALLLVLLGGSLVSAQASNSVARQWNEALLNAIRKNSPNPPAHARNLFHVAVAMYDTWAAYDGVAVGYVTNEKISPLPGDIAAARDEAISYAAYRVIRARFRVTDITNPNYAGWSNFTSPAIDTLLGNLYGDGATATAQAAVTASTVPAEVGKRIAQAILNWGANDGFSQVNYPQAYGVAANPNWNLPMSVEGTNRLFVADQPLGFGVPAGTDPNFWQPLDLATSVDQFGNVSQAGKQAFVGVQSLATVPFSLTRVDPLKPWLDPFNGPSKVSTPASASPTDADYKQQALAVIRDGSVLNSTSTKDISPGAVGNNSLGTDTGTGHPLNPSTNAPYAPNVVKIGDYTRCLAEFWADGPHSETPPGHWHVLANEVTDELTAGQKKIRGVGAAVNDLEWDVKMYFCVAGAVHDAACCAWSLKRYYSGTRPITLIRWLCSQGQSTLPDLTSSYSPYGIPLEENVCEVITDDTADFGGKHYLLWDLEYGQEDPGAGHVGEIAVRVWNGEHKDNPAATSGLPATHGSPVRWVLGKHWLPFQRKTFNTPAFPGYISGHSTFSRAAAEALTLFTGSSDFPGGFHQHTIAANSLQIDLGPSAPVTLQWRSFYDAADQAGQSRRFGGIHVSEDDYHGRVIGSAAGKTAFALAEKYWTGTITQESMRPNVTVVGPNTAALTWTATRGMLHKVQTSGDLASWTDATTATVAYDTNGTWTDTNANPTQKFYRIVRTP